MKRTAFIIALAVAVISGCKPGLSGEITTEETEVSTGYKTVKVKGYARIITNVESRTLKVTTDKKLQKCVKIKDNGRTLIIDASNAKIKAAGERPVSVEIPYSSVFDELKMEGSSTFDFEMMLTPHQEYSLKGSNIVTGVICCETLKIESEGSDQILIDTNAESIELDLNGSSSAGTLMIPISATKIDCEISGSCVAYVEAAEVKGEVDGDSELHYIGDHSCKAKASGTARIINDKDREPMDITKVPRKL